MERKPKTTRRRTLTGQEAEMKVIGRLMRLMVQHKLDRPGKLRVLNFVLDAVTKEGTDNKPAIQPQAVDFNV